MPEPDPPLPPQEPISDREPPVITPAMRSMPAPALAVLWRGHGICHPVRAGIFYRLEARFTEILSAVRFQEGDRAGLPGMRRCVHALTRGRLGQAMQFHCGFVLCLPIVVYLLWLWIRDWRRDGIMPYPFPARKRSPDVVDSDYNCGLRVVAPIPVAPFKWLAIPKWTPMKPTPLARPRPFHPNKPRRNRANLLVTDPSAKP